MGPHRYHTYRGSRRVSILHRESNNQFNISVASSSASTDRALNNYCRFVHDIAEHCERYQSLFTYFASKGIEVQAFDLPGFGETGARADSVGITGG